MGFVTISYITSFLRNKLVPIEWPRQGLYIKSSGFGTSPRIWWSYSLWSFYVNECLPSINVWLPSKMVPLSAEYANPSLFLDIWPIIDIGDLIHQEVKGWKKNFIISSIEQSNLIAYSHWPIDGRPHNHFVDNLRQF